MRTIFAPLLFPIALAAWASACSASPPPPEPPPTAPPTGPSAEPPPLVDVGQPPVEPAASPTSSASATATPAAPKPEPASKHCPGGMKLVEGDYCTQVEQTCAVEWWAPQNKKRVCEKFTAPTRCVGSRVKKRFCIDTYSWPNQKGIRPEVMNTFYQAQVKCAAMGKRMCTESEWTFACEGPEMKPFPHGYTRDPKKCNGDHKWDNPRMRKVAKRDPTELARLWRGVPSGSQPECVSDFGVHDLPANNDEVVSGESRKAKFSSVNTGGPWYSGVRNQCRPKIYSHEEGFYYYFLGFRCCAEPDSVETEPRTPKQIRNSWKFRSVERLAQFTVDEVKEKLELKKTGACNCGPKQILCKTMCGTLLGPNAVDGDDSTRVPHRSRKKINP
ncbi:MAG: SUMF1/EgtB/PvdO family nonheme iron enzyme [Deltaproteobacteria bacterium]|nr:SUMF1/EgtB/PvdO family nonheme iron enzyme [Deltaproteobacteria bacterium]